MRGADTFTESLFTMRRLENEQGKAMKNLQTELGVIGMLVGSLGLMSYLSRPRTSWVSLLLIPFITIGGLTLYLRGRRRR
jgi:hypothetical protein